MTKLPDILVKCKVMGSIKDKYSITVKGICSDWYGLVNKPDVVFDEIKESFYVCGFILQENNEDILVEIPTIKIVYKIWVSKKSVIFP